MQLKLVGGGLYLGAYLGPRDELEAWVQPQVEAWSHRLRILGEISKHQSL